MADWLIGTKGGREAPGLTLRRMLDHPRALYGLSDAGAHVGTGCDASFSTFMLTQWVLCTSLADPSEEVGLSTPHPDLLFLLRQAK